MIPFENYCEGIKRFGGKVTYTKEEYELKYGMPKEFKPMIITPKNRNRPMRGTLENHIADIGEMVPKLKKKYAPKQCRIGWTQDQIKARKAENVRNYRARKKLNPVTL